MARCSRNLDKPARYDGKYLSYLTGLKELPFQDVCAVFFQAVAVKGFVSFVHAAVAVGGFRGGAGGWVDCGGIGEAGWGWVAFRGVFVVYISVVLVVGVWAVVVPGLFFWFVSGVDDGVVGDFDSAAFDYCIAPDLMADEVYAFLYRRCCRRFSRPRFVPGSGCRFRRSG